jgi:hypothetical protein
MASDKLEDSKRSGKFTLSPGREVRGELTLTGANSSLYLHDEEYFNPHGIPDQCILGVLDDLTKVSLIQCITTSGPGSGSRGDERYHFANIFPHHVVYGDCHITPTEKSIAAVHFVIDDATTLFYDFDAFGSLIDARPFIEQITRANGLDRIITTGPSPAILYFTGKREIFSADTVLGKVSATHNPTQSLGGPSGVRLDNTVLVNIAFKEMVTFEEAILRTLDLLRFLELVVGRPQNLLDLRLRKESNLGQPVFLRVYWSMPPKREPSNEQEKPHPADVLLDAVRQPEAFSNVIASWLTRQQSWRDARLRFHESFTRQRYYPIERLIGSANMFDILPTPAVPQDVDLSNEMKAAKEECGKLFRQLPASPERDSVLGVLGRVGKTNLKRKIRHRAQAVLNVLGGRFPELLTVTDEAVNCRNHYVHGSAPPFNYSENLDARIFFTDTLEFVFAASDLIEAGWDIKAWSEIATSMSHPFGRYRVGYAERLKGLKALLPRASAV